MLRKSYSWFVFFIVFILTVEQYSIAFSAPVYTVTPPTNVTVTVYRLLSSGDYWVDEHMNKHQCEIGDVFFGCTEVVKVF